MKTPKKVQKLYNTSKKIDENIHHKVKVLKRKQDILKLKNDLENEQIMPHNFQGTHSRIKGYTPKKKKNYGKILWKGFVILMALSFGYVLVVNFINL